MNNRDKDINEAADRAIKIVAGHYGIGAPHFNTEDYQSLFLAITDDLSRRFDKSYPEALDDLISEARSEEAAIRMGHLDQRDFMDDESGEEMATKREELESALTGALSELRTLRSHRCDFGPAGDGLCPVCTADGRA